VKLRDKMRMDGGDGGWSSPPGCGFWIALILGILACALLLPAWLVSR
jgi:hypothetical protein